MRKSEQRKQNFFQRHHFFGGLVAFVIVAIVAAAVGMGAGKLYGKPAPDNDTPTNKDLSRLQNAVAPSKHVSHKNDTGLAPNK